MSSFGDGNIKTAIQEALDDIFSDYYNQRFYEATAADKVDFLCKVAAVIAYLGDE